MTEKPFTGAWLTQQFELSGRRPAELVAFLRERKIEIDAPKLSKVLADRRRIQPGEIQPIWEFFKLPPDGLFEAMQQAGRGGRPSSPALEASPQHVASQTAPTPNAGLPERIRMDSGRMPIYGKAVGGASSSLVLFNGEPLGQVTRPASLAGNPRAYAAYVHGDSMEPRYEAGEIVLVNPDKGFRKGNYVVAQVYDNDGDPPFGYVKRFISYGEELVLEQLNPPEGEEHLMRFPRNRVVSVHRIVGTLDE